MASLTEELKALRAEYNAIAQEANSLIQAHWLKELESLKQELHGIRKDAEQLLMKPKAAAPSASIAPQTAPNVAIPSSQPAKPQPVLAAPQEVQILAAAKISQQPQASQPVAVTYSRPQPAKQAAQPAQTPANKSPVSVQQPVKPQASTAVAQPKPSFGGGSEKCEGCGKRVYPNEKLTAMSKAWHKGCFRCFECKSVLTPNTFYAHTDHPYCKMHYTRLTGGRI